LHDPARQLSTATTLTTSVLFVILFSEHEAQRTRADAPGRAVVHAASLSATVNRCRSRAGRLDGVRRLQPRRPGLRPMIGAPLRRPCGTLLHAEAGTCVISAPPPGTARRAGARDRTHTISHRA